MTVTPFALSHSSPYQSVAFLIRSGEHYTLFFGDTGPDKVEQSDHLKTIWTHVDSLVREKKLDTIFIEISFPNGHPDELLFGHLTPSWLMTELHQLAQLVDPTQPDQALQNLSVIVTHIKPSFKQGPSPRQQIEKQLKEIAKTTGGKYFRATDTVSLVTIYDEIDKLERHRTGERSFHDNIQAAKLAMLWGLALLMAELVLTNTAYRTIP